MTPLPATEEAACEACESHRDKQHPGSVFRSCSELFRDVVDVCVDEWVGEHHRLEAVLRARVAELEAENERLREALRFAASRFGSMVQRMNEEIEGSYEGYADEAKAGHDECRRAYSERTGAPPA